MRGITRRDFSEDFCGASGVATGGWAVICSFADARVGDDEPTPSETEGPFSNEIRLNGLAAREGNERTKLW